MTGPNYYHLKMVDIDGTYTFSNLVKVHFDNGNTDIKVQPNPVKNNNYQLKLVGLNKGVYNMEIRGVAGQLHSHKTIVVTQEVQIEHMLRNNILPGIYILNLIDQKTGKIFSQKVVFQ